MSLTEPSTVKALRAQIARGATDSLLHRIAGSAAEFNRLASFYGLRGAAVGAPGAARPAATATPCKSAGDPPAAALQQRQAMLLALLRTMAQREEIFRGVVPLAQTLDCSWLVVERDLAHLAHKKLIRIQLFRDRGQRQHRRIAIAGTALQTALPAAAIGLVAAGEIEPLPATGVRPEVQADA
jgi:hypothetical protein